MTKKTKKAAVKNQSEIDVTMDLIEAVTRGTSRDFTQAEFQKAIKHLAGKLIEAVSDLECPPARFAAAAYTAINEITETGLGIESAQAIIKPVFLAAGFTPCCDCGGYKYTPGA